MEPPERKVFRALDHGWSWVILFASFSNYFLAGGMVNSVGVIHSVLLEKYEGSVSLTSWAGSLHSAFLLLGAPLSSVVADRFSCRVAIVLSGIFYVTGYIGTAFATDIRIAIFTCGIIGGIGSGLGCAANLVVIGFNFERRRNLALGVSLSGVGIGMFVLAPLMQAARDYYGVVGFFIILAAIAANVVTCGMLCFPSELEKHTKSERIRDRHRVSQNATQNQFIAVIRTYLKVLANRGVILMCLSFFLYAVGSFLVYLHLPHYIRSKGQSGQAAAFLVALTGIVSAASRIITGIVANTRNIDDVIIYSVSIAIYGLMTLVYPYTSSHYAGHVVYVISVGLFYGCCLVVSPGVHVKYVGINYISSTLGLQFFGGGVGALIGPVFAGLLVDLGGTYDQSFIVAGCCLLTSSVLAAVLLCVGNPPVPEDLPMGSRDDENCQTELVIKNGKNTENVNINVSQL